MAEQTQTNKPGIVTVLNATPPLRIVDIPEVADRFKHLYLTFNGKDAIRYYEAEKFHFAKRLQDTPDLQECTPLSLYGCFLDMAVNGLSFDPGMNHAFIVPRKVKVIKRNQDGVAMEVWEKRAFLQISGPGELVMRMNQGQIKYADNPILVFDNDAFRTGTRNGSVFVEHEANYPRPADAKVIACYLKITRNDESVDYKVLSEPELQKFRDMSDSKNSKAWTAGIFGMWQTKTIKHAFRSYPRIRSLSMTTHTKLASETDELPLIEGQPDIYGTSAHEAPGLIEEPITDHQEVPQQQPVSQPKQEPQPDPQKLDEDDFANPKQPGAGVQFNTDDDNEDF